MLNLLLAFFGFVLFIPACVFFAQVLSARFLHSRQNIISPSQSNIAVLIPAHNESAGIIATLESIKPQLKTNDRILVVADNCSDDTYDVAIKHGAEAIQRHDLDRRGKGFALDYGLKYLLKAPPAVLVIIDADCTLELNGLGKLASYALIHDKPVQTLNLMYAKGLDLKSKIAEFAWCIKNHVRPLGFSNLRLPCQLMGTGMAFPWHIISSVDLANGDIVEDMKLGIDLSKAGMPPIFYAGVKVSSYFPLSSDVQSGQRARWEHGHLNMMLNEVPKLLSQALFKWDKNVLALALDLSVPPLALLVAMLTGYLFFLIILYTFFKVGILALSVTGIAFLLVSFSVVLSWLGWGRNIISFSSLLFVPVYVFQKIPHYVKFLFNRQKSWTKTERD